MARSSHELDEGSLEFELDGGLRLTLRWGDQERPSSDVVLPVPASGYGGHEFVVSDDERYAALFLSSGQSEVYVGLAAARRRDQAAPPQDDDALVGVDARALLQAAAGFVRAQGGCPAV
jgi:hypothetical protein